MNFKSPIPAPIANTNYGDPTPTVRLQIDIPQRQIFMILQAHEQAIQAAAQAAVERALAD